MTIRLWFYGFMVSAFLWVLLFAAISHGLAQSGENCTIRFNPVNAPDWAGIRVYDANQLVSYQSGKATQYDCRAVGLGNGAHSITLSALDTSGNESGKSTPPAPVTLLAQSAKLPAPEILAPAAFAEVDPGQIEIRFGLVPGAAQYVINVHEEGTPYECERYAFCGNVSASPVRVTVKAGKKYDFWLFAMDPAGKAGASRGSAFTVKSALPPPNPPPPNPPPPNPPPPNPPPPTGKVFSNIQENGGELQLEYLERDCPKGTSRILKHPSPMQTDRWIMTITCER